MDQPAPPAPPDAPSGVPLADELPTGSPAAAESKASPPPDRPRPVTPQPHHTSPFRLLANVVVIFVSLFLFVRVFAVEPFGVPTGSMAPALIGNHREGPCPRCGYPVRVGAPTGGGFAEHYAHVGCPNCGQRLSLAAALDLSGDRLLVDKSVYELRRPRRWEMAVFHCPDPDPKEFRKPYVKRVIGLPGETITVLDGDVCANGELLRKGLAEFRETRVVVFDMAHAPGSGGWNPRWLVEPPENHPLLPPATARPAEVAGPAVVAGGVLTLDASATPQTVASVTYRHFNLDEGREEPIRAWNSYDGLPRSFGQLPAVNEFAVSCDVEVVRASGEGSFACRLYDGADAVHAEVTVGPKGNGLAVLGHDGRGPLVTSRPVSLVPGETHRVEFSFADRRAILVVDGRQVGGPSDLPPVERRGEVRRPLQLGARGCRLVVRNLKIYRDTYYTQFGENGTQPPHGRPVTLGPDEYFMLGDNSGNSQDSRKWPHPGVPEGEFIGKPFLIHQPLRPARLSLGGQERTFQTVDWSRLRWLH